MNGIPAVTATGAVAARLRRAWQRTSVLIWPEQKGEGSLFVRNVRMTLIVRGGLIGIGVITSVMIARLLGPEGRGIYAAAVVLATIASQFGFLGLQTSSTYYAAREPSLLPALVSNSLCASLLGGGTIGTILALLFWLRPSWAPVSGATLRAAFLLIPATLGSTLSQNLLLGIKEVKWFNVSEGAGRLFFMALCWISALLDRKSVV